MARLLSQKLLDAVEALCGHYPSRLAALLPALHLVMAEHGHIAREADVRATLDDLRKHPEVGNVNTVLRVLGG